MSSQAMSPIERAQAKLDELQGIAPKAEGGATTEEPGKQTPAEEVKSGPEAGEDPSTNPADDDPGSANEGTEQLADKHEEDDPNSETYKQRWKSLEGMLRSYKQKLDLLEKHNQVLEDQLVAAQKEKSSIAVPQDASKQDLQNHLQALADEYGEDFTNVLSNAIREEVRKILSEDLAPIKQQVKATAEGNELVRRERFEEGLSAKVPDWREIYFNTPEFEAYLQSNTEPFSGKTFEALFAEANNSWDLDRIAMFFDNFKTATGRAKKSGPSAKDPRASLVSPGKSNSSASTPQVQDSGKDTKIWTMAEVKAFYKDAQMGKYRGKEAEMDRIMNQIDRANVEGRIR